MDLNVTSKANAAASLISAGAAAASHAVDDFIDGFTETVDVPDVGVAGDAKAVMVGINLAEPVGTGGRKTVDFNAAFTQEVAKVLPGAKLLGEWTAEAVHEVATVLQEIPMPMMFRLQGTEFHYLASVQSGNTAKQDDEYAQKMLQNKLIAARRDAQRRALVLSEAAFNLPEVNGQSGFKTAMLRELGMLMNEKPARLEEFGRLSGWTQTVFDQNGQVLEQPGPATGFAPGEPVPGQRMPEIPGAAGTQRLLPSDTGRLGLGEPAPSAPPKSAASPTKRLTLSGMPSPVNRGPNSGPLTPGQAPARPGDAGPSARPYPGGTGQTPVPGAPNQTGLAGMPAGQGPGGMPAAQNQPGMLAAQNQPGTPSAQGQPGMPAAPGQSGLPGANGRTGTLGANGRVGTPGGNGQTATPGNLGQPATQGAPGQPAMLGAPGQPGAPGANGQPGMPGATASPGVARGPAGGTSPLAAPGSGNLTAPPGAPGPLGSAPRGGAAAPGSQGDAGLPGAAAPRSPAGPQQPGGSQQQEPAGGSRLGAGQPPMDASQPAADPRQPAGPQRLSGPLAAGAPVAAGSNGVPGAPAVPGAPGRQSGPLGTARPGTPSGRLGVEGRGPQAVGARGGLATTKLEPVGAEAVDGGSRVVYNNKTVLQYEHKADARFLPGNAPPADPREDFAEAFQAFMTNPLALLKAAPEKFLFLNAEARQFAPNKVQEMAKEAGVDLTQVVTSLVVGRRASQTMVDRICEYHLIAADKVALLAKDQELLGKSANLDGLVERLALDISANGAATTKLLKAGEQLRAKYSGLVGQLPLTREADGVGKGGFVSWLVGKATGGTDPLAKLDGQLAEVRTQFTKLPLAVQLRTDPRLALGANWFALSAQERAMLSNPEQLQQLVARAAAKADDKSYIPQNLTANEKAQLASRTMLEALFDPSSEGAAFRAKLTGANPRAALEELKAKNGEKVFNLLSEGQKRGLLDAKNVQAIRQLLDGEEATNARLILRDGTTGAEQLKAVLLRFQMNEVGKNADLKTQLESLVGQVKGVREALVADMGGSPLEVALTEINRQVQEGNMPFIQKFLAAKDPRSLAEVLGGWVTGAMTPAEKKLFEDADYRRHLVQNAAQIRTTGLSLADEARQYKVQTENIQSALEVLLRPDNQFREEFSRDPVQALKTRGLWVNLPDPIQQNLADGEKKVKLSQLVQSVQEAMSPVIMRQAGYQKRLDNLKNAIKGVNAGNYMGLLKLLDLSSAEMQRSVRGGLQAAMAGEAEHKAGGPLSFV